MSSAGISYDDLEFLALGAGILGTGGSNFPYIEFLNARELLRSRGSVELLDVEALADNDLVAEISKIGAPLPSQERLADPALFAKPVRMMEELTGKRFRAVMSGEIGTVNGVIPTLVASELAIPVVDADPIGRAFPGVHMSAFALAGLPYHPFAVADIRDNEVIISRSVDAGWTERMARALASEFGAIAATCRPPRTGKEVRAHAVRGSVSRAIRLGRAVCDARLARLSPIAAVTAAEPGLLLLEGKVADVDRRVAGGFLQGHATIQGLDSFAGSACDLDFRNEFTLARIDGEPRVMTPDLICVLDTETGEPVGTEALRYGQRVSVLAFRSAPVFCTPAGLAVVGPRALGFDFDYVPFQIGAR